MKTPGLGFGWFGLVNYFVLVFLALCESYPDIVLV
jgi:hypothetical protein